jgi:hypothetical protein
MTHNQETLLVPYDIYMIEYIREPETLVSKEHQLKRIQQEASARASIHV